MCPVSASAVKLQLLPSNHTIHQTYRDTVLIFIMLHFSVHCIPCTYCIYLKQWHLEGHFISLLFKEEIWSCGKTCHLKQSTVWWLNVHYTGVKWKKIMGMITTMLLKRQLASWGVPWRLASWHHLLRQELRFPEILESSSF